MLPWLRVLAVTGALVAATLLPASAEAPIGVNAAVNPQSIGTPPAGTPQPLAVGQPIVFNERIATAESGQTQILFRDQSRVSVGPGSDLVIDQFIYDPNAGTAKLAMSATRGVFRFVGGQISKLDSPVTLTTPSGTMGIRGGIFLARITADGSLTAVFVYGKELTVTGRNGAVTTVRRPGFAVSVDRAGDSPSAPFAAPRNLITALVGQFDGLAGTGIATGLTDARTAADPAFARLAGAIDLANRTQSLPGGGLGGLVASHPVLDSLAGIGTLDLSSVAAQGDGRLLQAIQAFRERRQGAD